MWALIKETFSDWSEDRASRLAAALSYYTVFAIAPLLILVIGIAGLVFDQATVREAVQEQVAGLIGTESATFIEDLLTATSDRESGIIATLLGLGALLLGATGLFGQLHDALNTIWEVQPKPGRGVLGVIKDRFLSFTMVLGVGFLLLVSLVISAGLALAGSYFEHLLPGFELLWQVLNFVISFAVITLLFAMIYKVLPDVQIAWRDVWIGAAVTALLFTIGKTLIGLYLGKSSVGSAFGAAGSLVVILVWIYYSSQILFLGAEFTQVYAKRYGSRIRPDEDAVPLTDDMRAQQGMPRDSKQQPTTVDQNQSQARPQPRPQTRQQPVLATSSSRRQQRPPARERRGLDRYAAALFGVLVGLVLAGMRGSRSGQHLS